MILKSAGNFLGVAGVLLLLFTGIKFMTFDAISEPGILIVSPDKSYPFEWLFSLGIGLILLGVILIGTASSRRLLSRIRSNAKSKT